MISTQLVALVKLSWRISLRVSQAYIILLLVWNVFRVYPGERWLAVQIGNHFAPWLFMGLVPILIVAVVGHQRWLIGVTLILLLIFAGRYRYLFTPRLQHVSAENYVSELRVMTFNVHFANRNAQGIANMIRAENPDIVAMQEMSPVLAHFLLPVLASEYPHQLYDGSVEMQIALISRYPLIEMQEPHVTMRAQHVLVTIPNETIVIWNVHPYPAFSDGGQTQKQLLASVATDIIETNRPVIVLGDLNTTDQTETYCKIATHLTDVHRAIGRGFGFTFPVADLPYTVPWHLPGLLFLKLPLFRLDYIFVNHHFIPDDIRVLPDGLGSDHRPVIAVLHLTDL